MKFKDFVKEREVKRCEDINEFFNQPINIITEIIEIGKTKITKVSSTKYSTKYWFNVDKELYEITFVKEYNNSYEMGFFLEKGDEQFTGLSNKFQTLKVYSGLLDTIKIFIEEIKPDKITMNITLPKKSEHFLKVMKMVFKKYNKIFGNYRIKGIKTTQIDVIILNTLTIEKK